MSKNINQTEDPNCVAPNSSQTKDKGLALLKYVLIGTLFGIVFVKAEIISWFRIQEMFRFQSFHMYGVIGTAVVVGAISVFNLGIKLSLFVMGIISTLFASGQIDSGEEDPH